MKTSVIRIAGGMIMWTLGILLPHAPVLVPEVAQRAGAKTGKTLPAVLSVKNRLAGSLPDALFALDPHTMTEKTFTLIQAEVFNGNLGQFGAGSISFSTNGVPDEDADMLSRHLAELFPVRNYIAGVQELHYATVVPLHFLRLATGSLPPLIIANPVTVSFSEAFQLGQHLRKMGSKRKWGLLASGDLSHRLSRNAPSGYHPDGRILDDAIQKSLLTSSPDPIFELDPRTIENAGECGLRSVLVLLGLSLGIGIELLSYEAPFGVGYATAAWFGEGKPDERD